MTTTQAKGGRMNRKHWKPWAFLLIAATVAAGAVWLLAPALWGEGAPPASAAGVEVKGTVGRFLNHGDPGQGGPPADRPAHQRRHPLSHRRRGKASVRRRRAGRQYHRAAPGDPGGHVYASRA